VILIWLNGIDHVALDLVKWW